MISPKVKKGINPQTGQIVEIIQWPNIFIYGLTDDEKLIVNKSLPSKEITVTDITGEATDLVTQTDFALIINPYNISEKELRFFVDFYDGFEECTESIIFTEIKDGLRELFPDVRVVEYSDIGELEYNLKYDLLQALRKTNKADNFSKSLSQAIVILFAIRNNPYITTKALADKIERTPRTVQRYIETLRCAGEWIVYDKKKKGWYLYDGKSLLLDEI